AIVLLLVWLYGSIAVGLFSQWTHDKDFGHGPFVPIFALIVLWQNRDLLKKIPAAPSWTGALILAGGLTLLVIGQLGAEPFLSRVSMLFLFAGFVILFRGWRFFR